MTMYKITYVDTVGYSYQPESSMVYAIDERSALSLLKSDLGEITILSIEKA